MKSQSGGLYTSIHQKLACAVMGKNFFGVEDWSALYGANFSQKQLRQVAEFPWGKDILNSTCPLCGKVVKDCHFAFVGLDRINGKPLTILQLQKLHPATGQPRFVDYAPSAWYSKQKFAKKTTMSFRWYLLHQNIIHKNLVPKPEDKTFKEEEVMFDPYYEEPSAVTEVMKDLLFFHKRGKFANPKYKRMYAWCKCEPSTRSWWGSCPVDVGGFGSGGLDINSGGFYREDDLGEAASRKFPSTSSG